MARGKKQVKGSKKAPASAPAPQPTSEQTSTLGIVPALPSAPSTQTTVGWIASVLVTSMTPLFDFFLSLLSFFSSLLAPFQAFFSLQSFGGRKVFISTTLFPSLLQTLHDGGKCSDSSIAAILKAVAKFPSVNDETSLWNALKPKEVLEMRTLLSEYLAPPLEDTAALELLKWVKTFTPPKDKIPAGNELLPLVVLGIACLPFDPDACRGGQGGPKSLAAGRRVPQSQV